MVNDSLFRRYSNLILTLFLKNIASFVTTTTTTIWSTGRQ